MTDTRTLVLVGSLRADSYNRRLAHAVREQAPVGSSVEVATGLDRLPFYNEDLDNEFVPAEVAEFRALVAASDRVLVFTPEYNGTMPAVLNNAIDWLSRPFGAGALRGKPLAVVGTSVGAHGGQWAHQDVQRSAKVAGAQVVEDIVLNHQYAWGSDPVADAATVELFVEALGKLTAYEVIAA